MWFRRRRQRKGDPPQGILLIVADGDPVACDVIRDADEGRLAVWHAVPRTVPAGQVVGVIGAGLPPLTTVRVRVTGRGQVPDG